jgi:PhnB protein
MLSIEARLARLLDDISIEDTPMTAEAVQQEADVRATIAAWAAAISARDAERVVHHQSPEVAHASLAPPLRTIGSDRAGMEAWFATWRTLSYRFDDYVLDCAGDLAFCHGIARMAGTKTDGYEVDLSFRLTLGLHRHDGAWKIVHRHESVPFHMDGSFRAAVELTA